MRDYQRSLRVAKKPYSEDDSLITRMKIENTPTIRAREGTPKRRPINLYHVLG